VTTLNSPDNKSPFAGVMESATYRARWLDFGAWEVFQRDDNVFVRIGQCRADKTSTLESLITRIIDSEDADY
jgi:hypothetical protein